MTSEHFPDRRGGDHLSFNEHGLPAIRFIESQTNSATWEGDVTGDFQVSVTALDSSGNISLFSPETGLGKRQ